MRIIDYFDRGVLLDPQAIALISNGETHSYADLQAVSRRIAAAIMRRGMRDVAHVAILSKNHPLAVQALLGVFRAGAAWVPLNPLNRFEANAALLSYTDVEWLFYHSDSAADVRCFRESAPTLRHFVCLDREDGDVPSLETLIAEDGSGPVPEFAADPNRICAIFPTGGTTGPSKAATHTLLTWQTCFALGNLHWHTKERPVFLGVTPMTHAAAIIGYLHTLRGGTMILENGFDPDGWCEAVERHRVTHTFLPPTALYTLLAHPGVRSHDYSSLRYFCISAAPVSGEKLAEAVEVFGPCICEVFGQVESPVFLTALSPQEIAAAAGPGGNRKLLDSCGRPTFLARVAIVDDEGNVLASGQVGEIVSQSFLNAPGYYKKPDATDELTKFGWHHTGDIGYQDERGYFFIVDRKKDMIITGGFNVFSAEVEQAVLAIASVQDCAVIGVPDDKWGEAVTAVITLKPGARIAPEDVIAACKGRLGSVKAPKRVEFWDCLPRTANGKIDKKTIRERYWAGRSRRVH